MELINTVDAVGHILCHDMTQIIPGISKETRFRKGHVVTEADIPVLLSMGKDHLYVWEISADLVHEDEAAEHLRVICQNEHMHPTAVKEGKIELIADVDGLFTVDIARLNAINTLDELMIATRHSHTAVKAGDKLAATRVIPMVIAKEKLTAVAELNGAEPLLKLTPWKIKKAGLVVTGSEVFHGRIEDKFGPVVEAKLAQYGVEVVKRIVCDDDKNRLIAAINDMREAGVEIIACTGGMSVDPDDRTPGAIKDSGANIISYGAPVLPGAMFLLGYYDDGLPIIGLPGCVMYAKSTIFDLVLPRLVAGASITKADLAALGHGGLCLDCPVCHYPICPFGKGA